MTGGTPILRPVLQDADGNPMPVPRKLSLGFNASALAARSRSMSMRSRIDSGHGLLPDPPGPIYSGPYYTPDGQLVYYPMMVAPIEPTPFRFPVGMVTSRLATPVEPQEPSRLPQSLPTAAQPPPALRLTEQPKKRPTSPMLSYGQLPVLAPAYPYPGYFVEDREAPASSSSSGIQSSVSSKEALKLECKEEFPEISLAAQKQERKKAFGKFKKPNKSGSATRETSQCSSGI